MESVIMYEMYPDAWPTSVEQRANSISADKPRRRVRRAHSVTPPVLTIESVAHESDRSA